MPDVHWFPALPELPELPELNRVVMVWTWRGWRPAIRRESRYECYIATWWDFVDTEFDTATCRDAPHWRECQKRASTSLG